MMHVLVVEADKILRSTYVAAFRKHGFKAKGVVSAQSAILASEKQKPDVIVLELQLQGHSGVELLHELRSYPEWQDIPVILHTMVPWKEVDRFEHAFKVMGITLYLYKPETSLRKLTEAVSETVAQMA